MIVFPVVIKRNYVAMKVFLRKFRGQAIARSQLSVFSAPFHSSLLRRFKL